MAVVLHRNEFSLEVDSVSVTVPSNDVARLMYYLNCVCTAIDCNRDPDLQRFTNYRNWYSLSISEQKELLVLCYTFSPDVFDDRVFFHSDVLCQGSSNKFYKVSQVRQQLIAAESIVIAGQVREVHKIMTYTMGWMKTFYIDPMQRLAQSLSNPRPAITSSVYTPRVVHQPTSSSSSSKCNGTCVCVVLYCLLCVVPGIIGIIVSIVNAAKS
ncbi:unnamed protein product [Adineta ricciae]|uniref:Uncharacterized protein n=1 Tax=Adineta ricciae TaxID=249248 RepID=A0A815RFZ6_ADIRI|nr:unnamed protein product [Adineta ricciae]CAF1476007.1 unnamed protein product [Adineta ricciae]